MHARYEPDEFACRVGKLLIERPSNRYRRSLFVYGAFLLLPVPDSPLALSKNVETAACLASATRRPANRMSCTYPEADLIDRTKWNL